MKLVEPETAPLEVSQEDVRSQTLSRRCGCGESDLQIFARTGTCLEQSDVADTVFYIQEARSSLLSRLTSGRKRSPDPFESERAEAVDAVQRGTR